MELCNATVRLAGDLTQTVTVRNCTPIQLALLHAINGEGSVQNAVVVGEAANATGKSEKQRLLAKYRSGDAQAQIQQLMPGPSPTVPTTLAELDFSDVADEDETGGVVDAVNLVPDAPAADTDAGLLD